MSTSKVYFTSFHVQTNQESMLDKLRRLMKQAGFERLGLENRFAALKIHFGEPGNLAYLRPNYAKAVADYVTKLGGRPFLTDCNTLYVGRRKNALDHLDTAYENGFSPFSAGCHVIIGDGLKGTDEVRVPVRGILLQEAMIGRAVMDADVFLSLTHFKMHECTGIGGVMKNIGMGCGSRAGKMAMHADGKPQVDPKLCIGCGACRKICAHDGPNAGAGKKMTIDHAKCVGCGRCLGVCPVDAIQPPYDESNDRLNQKIAEYALAVVEGRPQFHLSFVMDVVPFCDCHSESDTPVVPDVGIFASTDPVALDVACAEAVNRQPVVRGSLLDGKKSSGDYFHDIHPTTDWRVGVKHAVQIGLGSAEFDLVEVK